MSLINDALRRTVRPAVPRKRESDRVDGVIAALGYSTPKRRRLRDWIPVAAGVLIVAGLGAWLWWPTTGGARREGRGA